MPIEEHKNIGLPPRAELQAAGGSSNSNSHNTGGGGEITRPELEQVLGQLSDLLPRLEQAVRQQPDSPQ
jgi:hypothetical protein